MSLILATVEVARRDLPTVALTPGVPHDASGKSWVLIDGDNDTLLAWHRTIKGICEASNHYRKVHA